MMFPELASFDLSTKGGLNRALTYIAAKCTNDPLTFVEVAFPWGKGSLAGFDGPDQWQREVLSEIRDRLQAGGDLGMVFKLAIASGHGIGKALDVDLIVDTPTGPKRWGDIGVGDYLYGPDGLPTRVVNIPYRGVKECFKVSFDDGTSTIASGEHLWTVRGRQQRRKGLGYVTLSTQEISSIGVKRSNGHAQARQWELPSYQAVDGGGVSPTVNPYLLGLWLGNGDTRGCIAINDQDVIDKISAITEGKYSCAHKSGTTCVSVRVYGFIQRLKSLGINEGGSLRKHFPDEVRLYNKKDRLELLRGLIDTDGEVSKEGSLLYSTISKQLAEDVCWLVRSLGGKARIFPTLKQPFYRDKAGNKKNGEPCYRLTLTMPRGVVVSNLPRKQNRIKPEIEERYIKRWIDSIDSVGERECMCVTVDRADGLFLANDFIVTHNSCTVAWIILWALCTFPDTRGVVTANTDNQLKTKTFAELAKWHNLCIFKDWFSMSATRICSKQPGHEKNWVVDAIPWNINTPEGFAGLHNQGKRIIVIFDEASSIPDIIWEVTEGALTDKGTQIFWLCFGNPTRSAGRFYECFNRQRDIWRHKHIDSRTAKATNKEQIAEWLRVHGEDSDFFRVRVRGEFPNVSSMQFIARDVVESASSGELSHVDYTQMVAIIGLDVARFGDDSSVIYTRIGLDGRSFGYQQYRGLDGWQLGAKVAEHYNYLRKQGIRKIIINVDSGGVGASPIDWLQKNGYPVNAVNFGSKANNDKRYKNKRAEIWGEMREWLGSGGRIPDSQDLITDLTGIEYDYTPTNQIILERKDEMKSRGLSSPDIADALALTFAVKVNEYLDDLPSPERSRRVRSRGIRDPYAF